MEIDKEERKRKKNTKLIFKSTNELRELKEQKKKLCKTQKGLKEMRKVQ